MPGATIKPGNPRWIQWLKEWETKLADNPDKNERIIKAIKKARKSFEMCPLPINHPANASHLKFVGEKTIKYLTQQQQMYCDEKGIDMPEATTQTWEQIATKADRKNKRKQAGNAAAVSDDDDERGDRLGALNGLSDRDVDTSPPKKPRKSKPYKPRLRSGAFAILVGIASYGTSASATEAMIVKRGDPFYKEDGDSLADQDKNTGGAGHYGYSGWSSMNSTLVKKGLVSKAGRNPINYTLTYEGWKIARAAVRHAKKFDAFDEDARNQLPVFEEPDASGSDADSSSDDEPPKRAAAGNKGAAACKATHQSAAGDPAEARVVRGSSADDRTGPFLFFYLNNEKQRVKQLDQANISIDGATFTALYHIEFQKSQQQHVITRSLQKVETGDFGTCTARMPANIAPETASGFSGAPAAPLASTSRSTIDNSQRANPKAGVKGSISTNIATAAQSRNASHILLDSDSEPDTNNHADMRSNVLRAAQGRASAPGSTSIIAAPAASTSTHVATVTPSFTYSTAPLDVPFDRLVTLAPDTYDVMMLLDVREEAGLGKGKKGDKLDELLTKRGVNWEPRSLSMGDVIWIAKSKIDHTELVLDCCLERKRLDDLVSSLKDGRYMEQKNRMKRSGISRLIYLVEESEGKSTADFYEDQIWTIKSSMQVVDDFSVHIVKSAKDVCFYLAALTSVLAETHKYSHLRALPDEGLTVHNFRPTLDRLRKLRPAVPFCIEYDTYSRLHSKVHTVATTWAKMAASIDGMSLERAERFLKRFSTPIEFFAQLDIAETQDAIEEADQGSPRRKKGAYGDCWVMRQTAGVEEGDAIVRPIGQALSTKIWDLYTAEDYAKAKS